MKEDDYVDKVIITSDSGMDSINQEYMINAVLNRNDGATFFDVSEINSKEVLEELKQGFSFKTSAAPLSQYYDLFEKIISNGDKIIHISMGDGISSASLNSANIAASDVDSENISVIDSKNGATGGTLITSYAEKLASSGLSYKEILEKIKDFITRVHTSFFVPSPIGFQRSGRDSSELCLKDKALIIGSKALTLAGIKFRVDFNDKGKLYAKKMLAGNIKIKAMQMIKEIINDNTICNFETDNVVIGTVLEDKVNMSDIKDYLSQYFSNVIRQDINSVVAAYGSADLIGISLTRKKCQR